MDPCTTEIYTLSLHDALPIWRRGKRESVENVLHGKDQILPSVELIGHRRGVHATAGVQVPQGFARHRIKSEQIADRKSTRLNSSHTVISYAVFCLKKKK